MAKKDTPNNNGRGMKREGGSPKPPSKKPKQKGTPKEGEEFRTPDKQQEMNSLAGRIASMTPQDKQLLNHTIDHLTTPASVSSTPLHPEIILEKRERKSVDHFNIPRANVNNYDDPSGSQHPERGFSAPKTGGKGGKGGDGSKATPKKKVRDRFPGKDGNASDDDDAHVRKFVPDEGSDWSKIGGMEDHIQRVRENVIAPLLNPKIFTNVNKNLGRSKGILFHGPPGTGKTLMARGLVGECKKFDLNVTFYARKSADILSKYIGEGERHLRELFDVAKKNSPAVIFFDEIDGLAPVRTSGNDQSHSSIVSTLLAIMDGMDDRGTVIVIGATNRPDSLDPALRRPGRFDFELEFKPPDIDARRSILKIHAPKGMSPQFHNRFSQLTAGFTGADLEQLCSEAAMISIRRNFPEMHMQGKEHLLKFANPDRGLPTEGDFDQALVNVGSSASRHSVGSAKALPKEMEALFQHNVEQVRASLKGVCPQLFQVSRRKSLNELQTAQFCWQHPHVMLRGEGDHVSNYVAPEILHQFDHLPVFALDIISLGSDRHHSDPKSFVTSQFKEAQRRAPSILYLPCIDRWAQFADIGLCQTLVQCVKSLRGAKPVCMISTVDHLDDFDDQDLEDVIDNCRVVRLDTPDIQSRQDFLSTLLLSRSENQVEVRLRSECNRVQEKKSLDNALKMEVEATKAMEEAREAETRVYREEKMVTQGAAPGACAGAEDLTGDIRVDPTMKKAVFSAIKKIASINLIKNPALVSVQHIIQDVMDKANANHYDTFDEFNSDVELLTSSNKDERKVLSKAWLEAYGKVLHWRTEVGNTTEKMQILRQNDLAYLKKHIIATPNDMWFYQPLVAYALCIVCGEGNSPLQLTSVRLLRELYPDIKTMAENLAAAIVSLNDNKIPAKKAQPIKAVIGNKKFDYHLYASLVKKAQNKFNLDFCKSLIKLCSGTDQKKVGEAITNIKNRFGIAVPSQPTSPVASSSVMPMVPHDEQMTDLSWEMPNLLPSSIESACDQIVELILRTDRAGLNQTFSAATIIECAFQDPQCAAPLATLSGLVHDFIRQQGEESEFIVLAEKWSEYVLDKEVQNNLRDVFQGLLDGIAKMTGKQSKKLRNTTGKTPSRRQRQASFVDAIEDEEMDVEPFSMNEMEASANKCSIKGGGKVGFLPPKTVGKSSNSRA